MSLSLTKALETYAEKAAAMLAHLAGKSLAEIEEAYVTPDQIFQQLSYIVSYIEECGEMLYSRHNANTEEVDGSSLGNKLADKGMIAKNRPFLSNPKDQIKLNLNILMAQLGRHIMIHGMNRNTTVASMANGKAGAAEVSYANLSDISKRFTSTDLQRGPAAGSVGIGG